MKGPVFLLAAALAGLVLAGCAGPPSAEDPPIDNPGLVAVAPTQLEVGGFYAFRHAGGELLFATKSDGSADVVLYGSDDRRIGRIGVGDHDAAGRFVVEVAPGELVVEVRALEGEEGIDIRSAGSRVLRFERLPLHVERHVLLQAPTDPFGTGFLTGLLRPQPAEENVDFALRRAPSTLRLLQHGAYSDLAVVVTGGAGPVLQSESSGGVGPGPPNEFGEVTATFYGENVRDGALSAQVSASHFEGALVLEAMTFSRARPVAADVAPVTDVPRFTYGELPDQPVLFHVREETTTLYLFHEGDGGGGDDGEDGDGGPDRDGICPEQGYADEAEQDDAGACQDAALVALFAPDDRRVATVRVPFDATIGVPVALDQAGEWVAVLLAGNATLGADRVPADFELHPVEVRSGLVPPEPASEASGQYGQGADVVDGLGVVYRLTGVLEGPDVFQVPFMSGTCPDASSIVLQQGGETIGVWRLEDQGSRSASIGHPTGPLDPNSLLDGRPLTVAYDDFGPDCLRMALVVDGYVR